jgi:hypothetical protein
LPLTAILREDCDPATPLALKLDFTGAVQHPKLVRSSEPYKKGAYHKVVDSYYDDPWLQGRARFADGAHVEFVVVDHVRSSNKTKRSASGKTKRKVKNKRKTELTVTLTAPARNYAAASTPARAVPTESKADLLRRLGRHEEAASALSLTENAAERAFLLGRLEGPA